MRKDIGFVGVDFSLAKWLIQKLRTAPPEASGADSLLEGVDKLVRGEVSALMVELDAGGEKRPAKDAVVCGELSIYPRQRRVVRKGAEVQLTPKEYDILYFLVQNRGEVFTKEQIYRAVWSEDYLLDDSNIMAFIRKLRKKIEPDPDAPNYILTIWGIGYKFNDNI